MPTTQPTPRPFVAIHEVSVDDSDRAAMSRTDERTGLPIDKDGDILILGDSHGYVPADDVVLVDPAIVEALTDLPTLERHGIAGRQGWFLPLEARRTGTVRDMPMLGAADLVDDERLLADIRTLVAVYLARKSAAAAEPASPAHAALVRLMNGDAANPFADEFTIIRAALDKAAQA